MTVQFAVAYPVQTHVDDGAWLDPGNIARFARELEGCGFGAIAFTDHPAPSRKWLDAGGHESFDPFVALSFCAAATSRLRLMTNLAVVPYRNPLLQARSMMTVDVLSGGRSTFVLGTGYLRSEFAALGVDFDARNDLFDESAEVIRGAFTQDEYSFEGSNFKAIGTALQPRPVQSPHPPLWLGGNSTRALERVARWADGWSALMATPALARTVRTPALSVDELGNAIGSLHMRLEANGRDPAALDVMVSASGTLVDQSAGREQRVEEVSQLASLGVTWIILDLPGDGFDETLETLQTFAEDLITP